MVLIIIHYFPPDPKFPFLYTSISSSNSKLVHFCPPVYSYWTCCFNFGCNVVIVRYSRAPKTVWEVLWPNGQGIWLRIRGLQVRVLPGSNFFLQRYLEGWDTTVEAVVAKKALIFLSSTLSANPAHTQKLRQEGLPLWVHLNPNESPFIPFMSPKWKCVAQWNTGFLFYLEGSKSI